MDLLTVKETAAVLKVSVHTLAKWRQLNKGPDFVKVGKSVKYRRDSIEAWIKKKTVKTQRTTGR